MQITEYHQQQPVWRQGQQLTGEFVGLELEVLNVDGRQRAADALDSLNYGEYGPPIAERDGSLSAQYGVEIVCPPLPVHEALDENGYIGRMMEALRAVGTEEGGAGYGMHINFNVAQWPTDVAELCTYLLCADVETTVYHGGRSLTMACCAPPRLAWDNGSVLCSRNKYQPARLRTMSNDLSLRGQADILEFRAPASTLVHGNLRRAVEYVYAVKRGVEERPGYWMGMCLLHATVVQVRGWLYGNGLEMERRTFLPNPASIGPVEEDLNVAADDVLRTVSYLAPQARLGGLRLINNQGVIASDYENHIKSAIELCRTIAAGGDARSLIAAAHTASATRAREQAVADTAARELRRNPVAIHPDLEAVIASLESRSSSRSRLIEERYSADTRST